MLKKRVSAHVLEGIVLVLMLFFGVVVTYIFVTAVNLTEPSPYIVLMIIMLLQIIAILGLTFVVLKVWEQHVIEGHEHKVNKQSKKKITKSNKK